MKRRDNCVIVQAHVVPRTRTSSAAGRAGFGLVLNEADHRGHGSQTRGAAAGAAGGAAIGSFLGPAGALVGGGLGALLGYLVSG
jgi:hypothetical protein